MLLCDLCTHPSTRTTSAARLHTASNHSQYTTLHVFAGHIHEQSFNRSMRQRAVRGSTQQAKQAAQGKAGGPVAKRTASDEEAWLLGSPAGSSVGFDWLPWSARIPMDPSCVMDTRFCSRGPLSPGAAPPGPVALGVSLGYEAAPKVAGGGELLLVVAASLPDTESPPATPGEAPAAEGSELREA